MLEGIFRSKVTIKLLNLFLSNPEVEFYPRELERIIKEPISAVRRELKRLEKLGLLTTRKSANIRYYLVNTACPVYSELKAIFLKSEGVGKTLKENLKKIGEIEQAFIYGSFAKNEANLTSDLDLMIVGELDLDLLNKILGDLENQLGREINYIAYGQKEFKERKEKKDHFLNNVLKEKKIWLIGKENELKRTPRKTKHQKV